MGRTKELKGEPRLAALFAKAAATAAGRGGDVPDLEVIRRDVHVDADRLAAYDAVCRFTLRDTVPSTYLHVLTFPLQVALFADRSYPYPLAGSVHLANRIVQHRPVRVGESLRLTVRAGAARAHRRGAVVDVLGRAYVGDELVWEGTSAYLHRGQRAPGEPEPPPASEDPVDGGGAIWRLPSDLGRRYARVSGDVNPIHLSPLTAKALGFPRAIAHGMCTAARMLAYVDNRLPDAYDYEVAFRKPVLLPSTVRCVIRPAGAGGWDLALRSDRTDAVHVVSFVRGAVAG